MAKVNPYFKVIEQWCRAKWIKDTAHFALETLMAFWEVEE